MKFQRKLSLPVRQDGMNYKNSMAKKGRVGKKREGIFIKIITPVLLAGALLVTGQAASEIAVVVHPNNNNELNQKLISRIFLGKKKTFPDGTKALPLDQDSDSKTRSAFVQSVLKKSEQQIKAYWSQLLFTGKGTPPKEVGADADVKKLVSENPALIGYIDASQVDDTIKVVLKF